MTPALPKTLEYYRLREEIEEFLYEEAALLDERHYTEWLGLLTDDLTYFMPLRRNVKFGEQATRENTRAGKDISWFDEDKWTLSKRVEQIMTGIHWAEEPFSRVCRLIGNVQLTSATPSLEAASEITVRSRFLIYQNRVEYETNLFVGKRNDILRREGDAWKIARREIILEQSVLSAKNLTVIF
ncbi:MAG TPA: 3-phenylpropionate/cinnamic acid dioxygenase subunit beta [Candidatus Lustribacter sp.]